MKKTFFLTLFVLATGCGQALDTTPLGPVTSLDLTSQKKSLLVDFYVGEYRNSYNSEYKKDLLETITVIGRGTPEAAQFLIGEYRASYNSEFKKDLILLMGRVSHDVAADFLLAEYRASYNNEFKALIRKALMEAATDRRPI